MNPHREQIRYHAPPLGEPNRMRQIRLKLDAEPHRNFADCACPFERGVEPPHSKN